jgi:hypothetical protein
MSGFTDGLEVTILDHVFRGGSYSPTNQSAVFCACASGGAEITDATYARQRIYFAAAAAGATTSSGAVTFPAATAAYTVSALALYDNSATGTQITDWKDLTAGSVALSIGQQFRVPAGDYDLTLE